MARDDGCAFGKEFTMRTYALKNKCSYCNAKRAIYEEWAGGALKIYYVGCDNQTCEGYHIGYPSSFECKAGICSRPDMGAASPQPDPIRSADPLQRRLKQSSHYSGNTSAFMPTSPAALSWTSCRPSTTSDQPAGLHNAG